MYRNTPEGFFKLINLFIFGCAESSLLWGFSLVAVRRLLTAVASLVVEPQGKRPSVVSRISRRILHHWARREAHGWILYIDLLYGNLPELVH